MEGHRCYLLFPAPPPPGVPYPQAQKVFFYPNPTHPQRLPSPHCHEQRQDFLHNNWQLMQAPAVLGGRGPLYAGANRGANAESVHFQEAGTEGLLSSDTSREGGKTRRTRETPPLPYPQAQRVFFYPVPAHPQRLPSSHCHEQHQDFLHNNWQMVQAPAVLGGRGPLYAGANRGANAESVQFQEAGTEGLLSSDTSREGGKSRRTPETSGISCKPVESVCNRRDTMEVGDAVDDLESELPPLLSHPKASPATSGVTEANTPEGRKDGQRLESISPAGKHSTLLSLPPHTLRATPSTVASESGGTHLRGRGPRSICSPAREREKGEAFRPPPAIPRLSLTDSPPRSRPEDPPSCPLTDGERVGCFDCGQKMKLSEVDAHQKTCPAAKQEMIPNPDEEKGGKPSPISSDAHPASSSVFQSTCRFFSNVGSAVSKLPSAVSKLPSTISAFFANAHREMERDGQSPPVEKGGKEKSQQLYQQEPWSLVQNDSEFELLEEKSPPPPQEWCREPFAPPQTHTPESESTRSPPAQTLTAPSPTPSQRVFGREEVRGLILDFALPSRSCDPLLVRLCREGRVPPYFCSPDTEVVRLWPADSRWRSDWRALIEDMLVRCNAMIACWSNQVAKRSSKINCPQGLDKLTFWGCDLGEEGLVEFWRPGMSEDWKQLENRSWYMAHTWRHAALSNRCCIRKGEFPCILTNGDTTGRYCRARHLRPIADNPQKALWLRHWPWMQPELEAYIENPHKTWLWWNTRAAFGEPGFWEERKKMLALNLQGQFAPSRMLLSEEAIDFVLG